MSSREKAAAMPPLYHFTSSYCLPWILRDGLLTPNCSTNNFPDPDFLWATVHANGDASASAFLKPLKGQHFVRFSVDPADFEPWAEAPRLNPAWTPEQVARLDDAGRRLGADPGEWYCRLDALPRERWRAIETRGPRGWDWLPFNAERSLCTVASLLGELPAVRINRRLHCSYRPIVTGRPRYIPWTGDMARVVHRFRCQDCGKIKAQGPMMGDDLWRSLVGLPAVRKPWSDMASAVPRLHRGTTRPQDQTP